MEKEEVYTKLNEVFQDVFDDETILIDNNTTAEDIEDWDSLAHIALITAIQQEFGIKFTMQEVLELKNVGQIAELICNKKTNI